MAKTPKELLTQNAISISIDKISPNDGQLEGLPKNPRIIRDAKYKLLLKSIEEMPEMMSLRELVVVQHGDQFIIVGGNMRYRALKELGYKRAPCKVLPSDTPVQFLRDLLLRDNSSYGEWDLDALANDFEMEELDAAAIDIPDIEDPKDEQEAQEDNYNVGANVPEQPKSRLGDMFKLGNHRLICGDSTQWKFVEKLLDGEQADCLITDPPYNVDYKGSDGKKIENDHMESNAFLEFLCDAFKVGNDALKPGGAFYIWHADANTSGYNFRAACANVGWQIRQTIIWVKNAIVLGRQDYQWKHEPCLYGWKEGAGHYFINRRDLATVQEDIQSLDIDAMSKAELKDLLKRIMNPDAMPTTIIDEKKPLKNDVHPTMKPLKLIGRQIRNSTRPGETVLDLFGGSGSTMMAAEQLGRRCYMVEFDPKYADVIVKRWEELTGKQAAYLGNILDMEAKDQQQDAQKQSAS